MIVSQSRQLILYALMSKLFVRLEVPNHNVGKEKTLSKLSILL